jgi:cell division protein FtsW
LLVGLGVVMNYSTTAARAMGEPFPPLAARHIAGVLAAGLTAIVVGRIPIHFWRRLARPAWLIGVVLLALTLTSGLVANGARRWLAVPGLPVAIQPAEFARVAAVLAVSALLAHGMERGGIRAGELRRSALLVAVPVGLLLLQPDFGSALILVAVVGILCFAAGTPMRLLAAPALVAGAGAALYIALRPYALARIKGFLDPWLNANAEGFQLVQSFVAFGRGGSFGVGLGDGRQKLFFLPEAHTDFILAVIAEELGLLGVLVVLGSFAAFARAGLRVASHAAEPFVLLACAGMTALVATPAILNAAVVMGLVPTTGLTLPFLSHGSNSLLCAGFAVGLLWRAAHAESGSLGSGELCATPRGRNRT